MYVHSLYMFYIERMIFLFKTKMRNKKPEF